MLSFGNLLTILLTNYPPRSVIHKHGASRQSRERPARWHNPAQAVTARHHPDSAHNPKVAGSNPAPATTKALVDRKIRQGFFASSIRGFIVIPLQRRDAGCLRPASRVIGGIGLPAKRQPFTLWCGWRNLGTAPDGRRQRQPSGTEFARGSHDMTLAPGVTLWSHQQRTCLRDDIVTTE